MYRLTNTSAPPLTVISPVGVVPVTFTTQTTTGGPGTNTTTTQVNLPVAFSISPGVANSGQIDLGDIPGGRFTFGYWFDPQHCFGLEWSFFILDRQDFDFSSAGGTSGPQLFNTGLANTFAITSFTSSGLPLTTFQAIPITLLGQASTSLSGTFSSSMWGTEINAVCTQCQFGGLRWACLGGVRYLNLNEDVTTSEVASLTPIPVPPTPPGTVSGTLPVPPFVASFFDHVSTHDHFIGPQIGINYDWCLCHHVSLEGFAKLAVGDMHEAFSLVGANTEFSTAGFTTTGPGLLVGPEENGAHRKRDRIAAIPELELNLAYQVTPRLRLFAGYDTLYISTIARGGTSIALATTAGSARLGPTTTPIEIASPVFNPVGSSMWIQGFNAGIEYRF
jgi:hypothetical protein